MSARVTALTVASSTRPAGDGEKFSSASQGETCGWIKPTLIDTSEVGAIFLNYFFAFNFLSILLGNIPYRF